MLIAGSVCIVVILSLPVEIISTKGLEMMRMPCGEAAELRVEGARALDYLFKRLISEIITKQQTNWFGHANITHC